MKRFRAMLFYFFFLFVVASDETQNLMLSNSGNSNLCCSICSKNFELHDKSLSLRELRNVTYQQSNDFIPSSKNSYLNLKCSNSDGSYQNLPDFKFECPFNCKIFYHFKCLLKMYNSENKFCPICLSCDNRKLKPIIFEGIRLFLSSDCDISEEECLFKMTESVSLQELKLQLYCYDLTGWRKSQLKKTLESAKSKDSVTNLICSLNQPEELSFEGIYRNFYEHAFVNLSTYVLRRYLIKIFKYFEPSKVGRFLIYCLKRNINEKICLIDIYSGILLDTINSSILNRIIDDDLLEIIDLVIKSDDSLLLIKSDKFLQKMFLKGLIDKPEFACKLIQRIIDSAGDQVLHFFLFNSLIKDIKCYNETELETLTDYFRSIFEKERFVFVEEKNSKMNRISFIGFVEKLDQNLLSPKVFVNIISIIEENKILEARDAFKIKSSLFTKYYDESIIAIFHKLSVLPNIDLKKFLILVNFHERSLESNLKIILDLFRNEEVLNNLIRDKQSVLNIEEPSCLLETNDSDEIAVRISKKLMKIHDFSEGMINLMDFIRANLKNHILIYSLVKNVFK